MSIASPAISFDHRDTQQLLSISIRIESNLAKVRFDSIRAERYIWIYALIDPKEFAVELDTSFDTSCDPIEYMLQQMRGRSWLVVAKLAIKLKRPSRVKASILVQMLGVSHVRVTSTHKPITHQ
jgi:hypothetical protein